jgi:hypothetical protein
LLAVAVAVCTINRVPGIWQTISHPRVRTSLGRDPHARNAAGAASATRNVRW